MAATKKSGKAAPREGAGPGAGPAAGPKAARRKPAEERPVTVVIAAMGGEGGGVLTAWLVDAARKAGLPVQATSIPGVAQRTGATTYYVEIVPRPYAETGDLEPVLDLTQGCGAHQVLVGGLPREIDTEIVGRRRRIDPAVLQLERRAVKTMDQPAVELVGAPLRLHLFGDI